jgi:hypothetical protein
MSIRENNQRRTDNFFHDFVKKTLAERSPKVKLVKNRHNDLCLFPYFSNTRPKQMVFDSGSQEEILQEFFTNIDRAHIMGPTTNLSLAHLNRLLQFIVRNYTLTRKYSTFEIKCRIHEENEGIDFYGKPYRFKSCKSHTEATTLKD